MSSNVRHYLGKLCRLVLFGIKRGVTCAESICFPAQADRSVLSKSKPRRATRPIIISHPWNLSSPIATRRAKSRGPMRSNTEFYDISGVCQGAEGVFSSPPLRHSKGGKTIRAMLRSAGLWLRQAFPGPVSRALRMAPAFERGCHPLATQGGAAREHAGSPQVQDYRLMGARKKPPQKALLTVSPHSLQRDRAYHLTRPSTMRITVIESRYMDTSSASRPIASCRSGRVPEMPPCARDSPGNRVHP